MNGLTIRFDRVGAPRQLSRWKRQMDAAIRRAVKAGRRAIHANGSGSGSKAQRVALKAKRAVVRTASAL